MGCRRLGACVLGMGGRELLVGLILRVRWLWTAEEKASMTFVAPDEQSCEDANAHSASGYDSSNGTTTEV